MTSDRKDQRIHLLMAPSEVKAIEDWMFANRIRTRGEAIRQLCKLWITHESQKPVSKDS